jgi:hypothetical protein
MTTEAVALREADALPAWNPKQVVAQVDLVHQIMREVMKDGEHFGVIPGTERKDKDGKDVSKPSLLQPGAQKLCMTFRLAPEYTVTQTDFPGDHREYRIGCVLSSIQTGAKVGEGLGICSTKESKYRWRKSERTCPACGKPAIIKGKAEWGGGFLCFAKKGGCGAKYKEDDPAITQQVVGQTENPDIADTYNTVLKMGKKRAFVDATIQALAVSDLFTQDVEDFQQAPPPVEPPPLKDVTPPATLPTVDQWTALYAALTGVEAYNKVEGDLAKVWDKYSGEERTALKRMRDKRKTDLMG